MKLSVVDRLVLMGTLPMQGSFVALALASDIRHKVEFPAEERERLKLTSDALGHFNWDPEAETDLAFHFSDAESDLIVGELKALDDKRQLNANQIGIYRSFVLGQ